MFIMLLFQIVYSNRFYVLFKLVADIGMGMYAFKRKPSEVVGYSSTFEYDS